MNRIETRADAGNPVMSKKIKIAVIGCGVISEAHLNAYSQCDDVDLVAVSDIDEKAAESQAEKFNTNYYIDYKEMLDKEKPDGVSICLPTFLHKEVALEMIRRGINILCEKPLAVTYVDAKKMVERAKQNNIFLMTGFCWRFHPPIIKIKEYISEGKLLGRILMFHLRFGGYKYKKDHWSLKKKSGGGILVDESVHAIDLFRYLAGEIKNLSGRTATFIEDMETEDSVIILLESKKGTIGVIEDSWATPASKNGIEIYGEKGSILTDFSGVVLNINGNIERLGFEDNKNWLHSKRFSREVNHFLKCIRKEEKPIVTEEDGLKAIEIVEAVLKSVKEKRWIEVN